VTHLAQNLITFINSNFESAEQLEILLMLKRTPETQWTAQDVSIAVLTAVTSASRYLVDLHAKGILSMEGMSGKPAYRYNPQTADLDHTLTELEDAYRKYRVRIIGLIYSKPIDGVRTFDDLIAQEGD
jgi:hypothetical protein